MYKNPLSLSVNVHQKIHISRIILIAGMIATLAGLPATTQAASLGELFGGSSETGFDNKKPLPVNEAFQVVPTQQGDQLSVQINVTKGYYAYKDKLKLELPTGVTASAFKFNQTPTYVDDPDFGRVPVFEQTVTATTTLASDKAIKNQPITIKWQGCAKAGLCYPPEKVNFTIKNLAASTLQQAKPASTTVENEKNNRTNQTVEDTAKSDLKITTITASSVLPAITAKAAQASTTLQPNNAASSTIASSAIIKASTTQPALIASSTQSVNSATAVSQTVNPNDFTVTTTSDTAQADTFGLTQHTGLALLLLFLAGLGLAFTPCVLPMLPIVANIVARQHNPSAKKGLLLTTAYGLGVATSYGILGAIVAVFGQSLGLMNMLQNPVILLGFAALFILLGLYMMDWLPIRLPASISAKLQNLGQIGESRLGSVTGSFITGFFSALVVSPCVSAPLAGAVAGVAAVGNPVIGFAALFLLGLGLSTPLILLGATQGNFMPKAGEWMNWVKKGFALLLFAVALLMIERVFSSPMMLLIWAIWFAVVAVWAWQWVGRGKLLMRALAFVLGGWMLCLLVGVATGSTDSWQPLAAFAQSRQASADTNSPANITPHSKAITIHRLDQLQPLIQQHPNLLVDVTADWCIECRIMDKSLFANPPSSLSNWQVVRLDVTENNADSKTVYQALQVFGPPVLLYYQNGKLVARQNGETKRPAFEAVLSQLTP